MSKESYVQNDAGEVTHIRITSDDGTHSDLYVAKETFLGGVRLGEHVEIADHHPDGTTEAFEVKQGFFINSKGKRKG